MDISKLLEQHSTEFTTDREASYRVKEPLRSIVHRNHILSFKAVCIFDSREETSSNLTDKTVFLKLFLKSTPRAKDAGKFRQGVVRKRPRIPSFEKQDIELGVAFGKEHAALSQAGEINGVAKLIDSGTGILTMSDGEVFEVAFVIQEWIEGSVLSEWRVPRGVSQARAWWNITADLLQIVSKLHCRGITHGDLCPANIMVREHAKDELPSPVVVDLGEAILFTHFASFAPNDFQATLNFCSPPEAEKGRYHPSMDIFSVGAILLWLATKHQISTEAVKNNPSPGELRRYLIREVRLPKEYGDAESFFHVISLCLQFEPNRRPRSTEEILRLFLELVPNLKSLPLNAPLFQDAGATLSAVKLTLSNARAGHLFKDLLQSEISLLGRRVKTAFPGGGHGSLGTIELIGDRNAIIGGLLKLISSLGSGDCYYALTMPRFWFPNYLGTDGRIKLSTISALKRGVVLKRIICVSNDDYKYPGELYRFFEAQRDISSAAIPRPSFNKANSLDSPLSFFAFRDQCASDVTQFDLQTGHQVALIHYKATDSYLAIVFMGPPNWHPRERDAIFLRAFFVEQSPSRAEVWRNVFKSKLEDENETFDINRWFELPRVVQMKKDLLARKELGDELFE